MPEWLWQDYLNDIHRSIELIVEFTNQQTFHVFEKDFKTQYAVIRCFEIIGEATKRLPLEFTKDYPDIPWNLMAGMRDRLIHGYDHVNIPMLWRTIQLDVPSLSEKLEKYGI